MERDIRITTMRKDIQEERQRVMDLGERIHKFQSELYGSNFEIPVEELYKVLLAEAEEDDFYGNTKWKCFICGEVFKLDDDVIRFRFYDESWEYEQNSHYHIQCLREKIGD